METIHGILLRKLKAIDAAKGKIHHTTQEMCNRAEEIGKVEGLLPTSFFQVFSERSKFVVTGEYSVEDLAEDLLKEASTLVYSDTSLASFVPLVQKTCDALQENYKLMAGMLQSDVPAEMLTNLQKIILSSRPLEERVQALKHPERLPYINLQC